MRDSDGDSRKIHHVWIDLDEWSNEWSKDTEVDTEVDQDKKRKQLRVLA